jgi:hypothetical protein
MSTEIVVIKGSGKWEDRDLSIMELSGGPVGRMLQIKQHITPNLSGSTPDEPGFVQLNRNDALNLVAILREWLVNVR